MIDQLLKEKVMIMNDQIEVEVLQIYIEDYHYLFEVYNTLDTKIKEEEDEI
jgi:LytS/YehU family sensor histidine kinase